jgi:hypothetical protein
MVNHACSIFSYLTNRVPSAALLQQPETNAVKLGGKAEEVASESPACIVTSGYVYCMPS